MPDPTISRDWLNFKDEDYAESVCLLLPGGHATLIDSDLFDWLATFPWQVLGRSVFYVERQPVSYMVLPWRGWKKQRRRIPAKTTMHSIHRMVMEKFLHESPEWIGYAAFRRRHVDHRNRNPWDNRRSNHRVATPSQNGHNKAKVKGKSSQYKGVCRLGSNKWRASVRIKGKLYYLGSFADETAAAMAFNRFVAEHCGEFAVLNPITALPSDEPMKPERRRGRTRHSPRKRRRRAAPEPILGDDGKPLAGFALFKHLLWLESQKRAEATSKSAD